MPRPRVLLDDQDMAVSEPSNPRYNRPRCWDDHERLQPARCLNTQTEDMIEIWYCEQCGNMYTVEDIDRLGFPDEHEAIRHVGIEHGIEVPRRPMRSPRLRGRPEFDDAPMEAPSYGGSPAVEYVTVSPSDNNFWMDTSAPAANFTMPSWGTATQVTEESAGTVSADDVRAADRGFARLRNEYDELRDAYEVLTESAPLSPYDTRYDSFIEIDAPQLHTHSGQRILEDRLNRATREWAERNPGREHDVVISRNSMNDSIIYRVTDRQEARRTNDTNARREDSSQVRATRIPVQYETWSA